MTKFSYSITTIKSSDGKIRTKYSIDGKPTELELINPEYVCKEIARVHEEVVRQGKLEKITTNFEVEN